MRIFCTVLIALLFSACGEETETNTLGGSVSRVYDLSFDRVRARKSRNEFAIQYVAAGAVPVQVVIDLTALPLDAPGTYELEDNGLVTGSRDGELLPDFVNGSISFTQISMSDGAAIAGEFSANVATQQNTYAVFGTFETRLEVLEE